MIKEWIAKEKPHIYDVDGPWREYVHRLQVSFEKDSARNASKRHNDLFIKN